MKTSQPIWKFRTNLGDANPLDYGGYFIYEDETGVYPAEGVVLETDDNNLDTVQRCGDCDETPCEKHAQLVCWTEYRFPLDRFERFDTDYLIPFGFGARTDLPHPLTGYNEWFADRLADVAQSADWDLDTLRNAFTSADSVERANAYKAVADYFGIDNFDSYPLQWTAAQRSEVKARFKDVTK